MEVPENKSEEEFVNDLKNNLENVALQIVSKVNHSALNYMIQQKKWIEEKNASEAEKFFLEKIPKVLVDELMVAINETLGLSSAEE